MQPNDNKPASENDATENKGADATTGKSILPPPPAPQGDSNIPADLPPAPEQPEIDSFTTFEVAGIKYILGLGLDSKVYNWDVSTGLWKRFVIKGKTNALDDVL